MKKRIRTTIYPEKAPMVSRQDPSESLVTVYADRQYGGPFSVALRVNVNGAITLAVREIGGPGEEVTVYERRGVPQRPTEEVA